MANISLTDSTYATGGIDTRVTLDGTSDATFQQMNGVASAAVAIETILGDGPALRGTKPDLAGRLAVAHNASGEILIGTAGVFTGLTLNYGLIATSANTLAPRNIMPIGTVVMWAAAGGPPSPPPQWLLCNGQAVSRTTYSALFNVISTAFGVGDGSTTFNVPDLRGRVPLGQDNMGGIDAARITSASVGGGNADVIGGTGGSQTHVLTQSEMPVHTHDGAATVAASLSGGGGFTSLSFAQNHFYQNEAAIATNITMPSAGGGGAHSNTQPWIALSFIIYAGV